jgi:hypothetical protein
MAIVAADWTITRSTKVIAYIGDDHGGSSPSYATVIEFHRWLQSLADDAVAAGDDELDITNVDPSRRSTDNIITLINGYTIGDTEAEHLYDGSIIYDGGDEIYDGIVNFGNTDVQIQLIQNGAVLSDDWWNYNGAGLNASASAGISHRFMIKTRTGGSDIDGRRLIGTCRRFGYNYNEFKINGTSRGNNVLALSDAVDLNNLTAIGTVAGWTGITLVTEGYVGLDINQDTTNEYYYSEWNADYPTRSTNDFYERMKWLTRDGSTETLYGLSGELFRGITHEITVDNPSATDFSEFESVSWTGGTGQMLAINDVNAPTKMWIQLLTGTAPTDGLTITGGSSGATCDVNTTVVDRSATISKPFIGASTGSSIIGGYGVGIQGADLDAADKLFDLTNTQYSPPNLVTNSVTGLTSGEDRVLVAPWNGSSYDVNGDPAITKDQLSLSGNLTTANVGSIVVAEAIPADTPSAGWIRVTDNDGFERRIKYTSWATSTFTVDTAWHTANDSQNDFDSVGADSGNDVYIAYLDELASATSASYQAVYSSDRNLVVIVRDGGGTPIKQFISSWNFTSSNSSIAVIRTTDV